MHLYHDENNKIASSKVPSTYADMRQKALLETVRLCNIRNDVAAVIAGDYNIRMDCFDLVNWISKEFKSKIDQDNAYFQLNDKDFVWKDAFKMFNSPQERAKFLQFDKEITRFNGIHQVKKK